MTVETTGHGEVVAVNEADQFQAGLSQYECGFYACAIALTMAKPGQAPKQSATQIIAEAEKWYAQYNGSDSASNQNGMTTAQEYALLEQVGLHYQEIATNISQVIAWVKAGYPILLSVTEASVYDLALGKNPYPWTAAGNHIILVTGATDSGYLVVRDSANCTSLGDPNSLRPGPRLYKASIQIISATVVVPPWRPRPASATAIPTADMQIPDGWSDDGSILKGSNGAPVVGTFRDYVLSTGWSASDLPMGPEQSADPVEIGWQQRDGNNAGTRQIFMYSELARTSTRTTYKASVGREYWTMLNLQIAAQAKTTSTTTSGGGPAPANKAEILAAARLIGDTATHLVGEISNL